MRNFHQAFDHGMVAGMAQAGIGLVTGGRGWGVLNRVETKPGHERMIPLNTPDGQRLKRARAGASRTAGSPSTSLADVYNSGTAHEEDQPVHLLVADTDICIYQCAVEYANPCQRFCPAAVYEMVPDARLPHRRAPADQRQQLRPLQDLRHHGSVRNHHLGAAGGGRRAELQQDVRKTEFEPGESQDPRARRVRPGGHGRVPRAADPQAAGDPDPQPSHRGVGEGGRGAASPRRFDRALHLRRQHLRPAPATAPSATASAPSCAGWTTRTSAPSSSTTSYASRGRTW